MSEWNVELEAAPESESAHVERRQAFRHRCNLQVSWCFFGKAEKGLWWTVVQDLSTTGIRLIVADEVAKGTILEVRFQRPEDESLSPPHLMRVRRVSRHSSGNWLIGCAFAKARSEGEVQAFLKAGKRKTGRLPERKRTPGERSETDPFLDGPERRRTVRRKGRPVTVQVVNPRCSTPPFEGWVLDRSAGGISVSLDHPFSKGIKVKIRPIRHEEGEWIEAIVRACRQNGNRWTVGFQWSKELSSFLLQLFG